MQLYKTRGGYTVLIIDRFEGDFAVVETSNGMINIPMADIPDNAKEGDVLTIRLDETAAAGRKQKIDKMMNDLFKW